MSESKHTPGPWEVRERVWDRDILPGDTYHVAVITRANDLEGLAHLKMVNGDYHVCKFNPTKDPVAAAMMARDARLIAAAPTMLEALKEAERFLDYFANGRVEFIGAGTPHTALEQVSAAIAKATGETA